MSSEVGVQVRPLPTGYVASVRSTSTSWAPTWASAGDRAGPGPSTCGLRSSRQPVPSLTARTTAVPRLLCVSLRVNRELCDSRDLICLVHGLPLQCLSTREKKEWVSRVRSPWSRACILLEKGGRGKRDMKTTGPTRRPPQCAAQDDYECDPTQNCKFA